MKLRFARLMLVFVCAAMAFGAPLSRAVAAEQPPCMSGMDDGADMPAAMPDCDQGTMNCAQHCAALFAGAMLPAIPASLQGMKPTSEAVSIWPSVDFRSLAGPPGLQPPK